MFLSKSDIAELTGYKYHKKQCEWFSKQGIKFLRGANGCPKVTWTSINQHLGMKQAAPLTRRQEPNFYK